MKKVKLYIAVSIDGYLAPPNGTLEWLAEFQNPPRANHGFHEMMESVDTLIMGGKTYHEFSLYDVEWRYKDKTTYVVSHRDSNLNETDNVIFVTENVFERIAALKEADGKDIWLVGGGKLISMLLDWDMIDEMQICYVPVVLGNGISLFPDNPKESKWEINNVKLYESGILKVDYQKKR